LIILLSFFDHFWSLFDNFLSFLMISSLFPEMFSRLEDFLPNFCEFASKMDQILPKNRQLNFWSKLGDGFRLTH